MNDLLSLTHQLGAAISERVGLKVALSTPKIEAMLRAIAEEERQAYCRDVLRTDGDGAAFRTFVEALLVHETYFFRHADQLRLLADELLPKLVEARLEAGGDELSAWCAGCSSGEEVYTVALLAQAALARTGAKARDLRITVLGTDVSEVALARARRADYALVPGLNSFRDVPDFARHHFAGILEKSAPSWSPSDELRKTTRFLRHNVVADPPPARGCDLVLCRNTLIYFDEDGWRRALRNVEDSLRPGGVLLLGPAEMPPGDARLELHCAPQAVYWLKSRAGAS